jgi:cytochrome c oxidase subunit IV
MAEEVVRKKTYFMVWIALLILTTATAWQSRVDLGIWSEFIVLLIASIKASLVALFFMGLRYTHQKMVWIIAAAGLFWLFLLLSLSATDYVTRNFLPVPFPH